MCEDWGREVLAKVCGVIGQVWKQWVAPSSVLVYLADVRLIQLRLKSLEQLVHLWRASVYAIMQARVHVGGALPHAQV